LQITLDSSLDGILGALRRSSRWLLPLSQALAVVVAALIGWWGYWLVSNDRTAIDRAAAGYAVALVLLGFAAWTGPLPRPRPSLAGTRAWVREHAFELIALSGIFAAGVFMRLFRFGDLPPHGYVILEEHINGGAMWDIINGARPYIYPSSRYLGALSLWLFGPSTTGLRAHTVAAGILSIPFFYLLMRELVQVRAALFATAIFASLRILGETSTHFETPMLLTIITVWLAVRGLRTGNVAWLVLAAFLCAVLSYEYETWKAVPLFLGAFVIFLALRALVLPLPRSFGTVFVRVRERAPLAARGAIIVAVALLIGLGPMFADQNRGIDIYFGSLERQTRDREARGTPGTFSSEAREQVKWSLQVYTPWVDPDYPVIGPVPTRGVIDRVTSVLIWLSVAVAALTFWRGYRALFVGWFIGGIVMAGLLLSSWHAWKLVGFLPPAIVLIGYLADDVLRLAERVRWKEHRWPVYGAAAAFAAIAVWAYVLNIRVQNANANDDRVLREYSNLPSHLYSICDNLRARPDHTFAIVAQRTRTGTGFTIKPETYEQVRRVWGDHRFVCEGLGGQAVADIAEAWPLFVDEGRPVTVIGAIHPTEVPQGIDAIGRALPQLGEPDEIKLSPGGGFVTLIYDSTAEELNARRGLVLRARSASGTPMDERVVGGPTFDLSAVQNAASWEMSGIVYLPEPIRGRAVVEGADEAANVELDGQAGETVRDFIVGWHLFQISGEGAAPEGLTIAWQADDGRRIGLERDHFFALADQAVWRHIRVFNTPVPLPAQRFDFTPYFTYLDALRVGPRQPLAPGTTIAEDRWEARWTVGGGDYRIAIDRPAGPVRVVIDGQEILNREQGGGTAYVDVALTPGDHHVQIIMADGKTHYIGALFAVTDARTGQKADVRISPF